MGVTLGAAVIAMVGVTVGEPGIAVGATVGASMWSPVYRKE